MAKNLVVSLCLTLFMLMDYPIHINQYSKTCINWPLKNRQNKDLDDKW